MVSMKVSMNVYDKLTTKRDQNKNTYASADGRRTTSTALPVGVG